jgi:ElaB/YqjD/DUF883 family membrane-anchored ribosome-binding protein
MTRHGLSSLLDSTQPLRDQARHARQCTTRYIQDEPFKAVLIAAAAGAVLMALGGLTRRPGRRD